MPRNLSTAEVDAFRARLLSVAGQRFAKHGVDGVSMRRLAQALGPSAMTPYRYFRNKDEILAAVRAAAFDRFAAALEEAAGRARGHLRAAGAATGEAYIRFAFERSRRLSSRTCPSPIRTASPSRPRQRPRAARDERGPRGAG